MKAWMLMGLIISAPGFAQTHFDLSYRDVVKVKSVKAKPVGETKLQNLFRPIEMNTQEIYRRPAIVE